MSRGEAAELVERLTVIASYQGKLAEARRRRDEDAAPPPPASRRTLRRMGF